LCLKGSTIAVRTLHQAWTGGVYADINVETPGPASTSVPSAGEGGEAQLAGPQIRSAPVRVSCSQSSPPDAVEPPAQTRRPAPPPGCGPSSLRARTCRRRPISWSGPLVGPDGGTESPLPHDETPGQASIHRRRHPHLLTGGITGALATRPATLFAASPCRLSVL
jgi:hypothetical protein